jgi:hypothetical protein
LSLTIFNRAAVSIGTSRCLMMTSVCSPLTELDSDPAGRCQVWMGTGICSEKGSSGEDLSVFCSPFCLHSSVLISRALGCVIPVSN